MKGPRHLYNTAQARRARTFRFRVRDLERQLRKAWKEGLNREIAADDARDDARDHMRDAAIYHEQLSALQDIVNGCYGCRQQADRLPTNRLHATGAKVYPLGEPNE